MYIHAQWTLYTKLYTSSYISILPIFMVTLLTLTSAALWNFFIFMFFLNNRKLFTFDTDLWKFMTFFGVCVWYVKLLWVFFQLYFSMAFVKQPYTRLANVVTSLRTKNLHKSTLISHQQTPFWVTVYMASVNGPETKVINALVCSTQYFTIILCKKHCKLVLKVLNYGCLI